MEGFFDGLAFVQAHNAVVDENGMEPVTDGGGHKFGCYGGVDASGHGANYLSGRANNGADAFDFFVNERSLMG